MADPANSVAELIREVSRTRDEIARADSARLEKIAAKADKGEVDRLADHMAKQVAALQAAVNQISLKIGRPGAGAIASGDFSPAVDRAAARGLLELKHQIRVPKALPGEPAFNPSETELEEAEHAVRGLRHLFKATSIEQIPLLERKALTSFSMGASGFILQPELSNQILSCLVDITDLTGLVNAVSISGPSIKFMVDDVRLQIAGWACDTSCFANSPPGNFTEGLGELEIKAEPLRALCCASRDLLEDSVFNVEQWVLQKVSLAFRNVISDAILAGDGIGKPAGLLHPSSGIPICNVSPNTPLGTITWQDLISLAYQVPMQWHSGSIYLLNQRSFGQILTMSDSIGRPIMIANPTQPGVFVIGGWPVRIATQLPDVAPGSVPVIFGNLKAAYTLINRKQIYMLQDPYSFGGYCIGFRFEARVGGSCTCSNACRMLRVK